MTEPYDSIATSNFSRFLSQGINNQRLRSYYSACFQDAIDSFHVYPCWACSNCIKDGNTTAGLGNKPKPPVCPTCQSHTIFEIATFQARASVVGNAFSSAFACVMVNHYNIPLVPTPGNTRTHDFEVTEEVAIEAKGSPGRITNPDGSITQLERPGMERSDTRKKAFDNGRTFRQRNPSAYFCVVSNSVPSDLVGYRNRDVNAVFDVTKADRMEAMIREFGSRVDLESLRSGKT